MRKFRVSAVLLFLSVVVFAAALVFYLFDAMPIIAVLAGVGALSVIRAIGKVLSWIWRLG